MMMTAEEGRGVVSERAMRKSTRKHQAFGNVIEIAEKHEKRSKFFAEMRELDVK